MTKTETKKLSYQERRQLNTEVALEVMRYKSGKGPLSASDGTRYFDGYFKRYWADDFGPTQEKFSPCEDMTDAMAVVSRILQYRSEKEIKKGGMTDFDLKYNPYDNQWTATFNWSNDVPASCDANTPEEAICRAALLAVRK